MGERASAGTHTHTRLAPMYSLAYLLPYTVLKRKDDHPLPPPKRAMVNPIKYYHAMSRNIHMGLCVPWHL